MFLPLWLILHRLDRLCMWRFAEPAYPLLVVERGHTQMEFVWSAFIYGTKVCVVQELVFSEKIVDPPLTRRP